MLLIRVQRAGAMHVHAVGGGGGERSRCSQTSGPATARFISRDRSESRRNGTEHEVVACRAGSGNQCERSPPPSNKNLSEIVCSDRRTERPKWRLQPRVQRARTAGQCLKCECHVVREVTPRPPPTPPLYY